MLDKYAIAINYFNADRTVHMFTLRSASIEWVELRVRRVIRSRYPKGVLNIRLAGDFDMDIDEGGYAIIHNNDCIGEVLINKTDRD